MSDFPSVTPRGAHVRITLSARDGSRTPEALETEITSRSRHIRLAISERISCAPDAADDQPERE